MSEAVRIEAEDLAAAVSAAGERLGVDEGRVEVRVLEERRGFLGIRGRGVVVEATAAPGPAEGVEAIGIGDGEVESGPEARAPDEGDVDEGDVDEGDVDDRGVDDRGVADVAEDTRGGEAEAGNRPQVRREEPMADVEPAVLDRVEDFVCEVLGKIGLDLEMELDEGDDRVTVYLSGEDEEVLIEREGRLLDALQYVLGRATSRLGCEKRLRLECAEYRRERDHEVQQMGEDALERVRAGRSRVRLPPLNPYERRIVHIVCSKEPGVTTRSEGEGFLKRVVVRAGGSGAGGRGRGRGRGGGRRGEGRPRRD